MISAVNTSNQRWANGILSIYIKANGRCLDRARKIAWDLVGLYFKWRTLLLDNCNFVFLSAQFPFFVLKLLFWPICMARNAPPPTFLHLAPHPLFGLPFFSGSAATFPFGTISTLSKMINAASKRQNHAQKQNTANARCQWLRLCLCQLMNGRINWP